MIEVNKLKNTIKQYWDSFWNRDIKIVYLHIEKSAGTSQRIFFFNNFGEEQVFWYGINSDSQQLNYVETKGKKLLGGHRFYEFYENSNYLYLAVVRDPIQSVVSLYSYFITQSHHLENWCKKPGFDKDSFDNTVNNCRDFRFRIENHQTRYFSATKTYKDSLKVIQKNHFMVGCIPHIKLFNETLGHALHLTQTKFPEVNKSKVDSKNKITMTSTTQKQLLKLLSQDVLLYEYILNNQQGLFNNIPNSRWNAFLNK